MPSLCHQYRNQFEQLITPSFCRNQPTKHTVNDGECQLDPVLWLRTVDAIFGSEFIQRMTGDLKVPSGIAVLHRCGPRRLTIERRIVRDQ